MWIPPDEQQTILPYDGTTRNIHVQPWNFKPGTGAPKVPRLPFRRCLPPRPPASLLSVTPASSILAPHVLNAMKMALITGKAGVATPPQRQDDTRKRKPVDDAAAAVEATNSINTNKKFISTREVMRAEAAYGIARQLVSWMDHIVIDQDGIAAPADEKLEEDIPTSFSTLASDVKIEDVKLEDLSSAPSFFPMYTQADEKLEDDEEIKTSSSAGGCDQKLDADEKKLDEWYRSGHFFSMPYKSSFEDSCRAQPSQHQQAQEMITSPAIETPSSEINTPYTQLSLSSQLSCDSCSSESQQAQAPATGNNEFGSPITFHHDQHDSTAAAAAAAAAAASSPLPLPLSLPLLPTLSELNGCILFPTGSPTIGNFHEKMDTGNGTSTLFPSTFEGWQALVTN